MQPLSQISRSSRSERLVSPLVDRRTDAAVSLASVPFTPRMDIQSILAPVRNGLQRVEAKMKTADSVLFAPLAEAFIGLIGSGGKRLRPAIALLSAEFNQPIQGTNDYDKVIALAAAVEMLHTSTLVHDDVIDGAMLRRGAPTLNAHWSGGSTILAGNYMFGSAAEFSAETDNMRVIRIFSDTLTIIVDGELRQLRARYNYDQPKDDYYHRIYAKTASLFCAATEGAAILSGLSEDFVQNLHDYGYNLGMAFQIVDDMLDFTGDENSLGKPAGSDLRQGTLTLPFFYFLKQHPAPSQVIERLEQARDQADQGNAQPWHQAVAAVVADLRRTEAVIAARHEAEMFLTRARLTLTGLPDTVHRRSLLALCDFVVERTY